MPITINNCKICDSLPVVTILVSDGDMRHSITCSDVHPGTMVFSKNFTQLVEDWNEINGEKNANTPDNQ